MSEQHIRRSGNDYGEALLNLLPQGPAWPRERTSVLTRVVLGLAKVWGYVDGRAADLLERESDPRQTVELIKDWERNWGLPDPCFAEPLTIGDRQAMLVRKMTMQGGQSRAFFIDVEKSIGYDIRIREWAPFMVGISRVGDTRGEWGELFLPGAVPISGEDPTGGPMVSGEGQMPVSGEGLEEFEFRWEIGPPEMRFYWSVHVGLARLTWFRCAAGQCGVDPHLRIGIGTDMQCLIDRWKPAHTEVVFDYSGLRYGGSMAGTP